VQKIFFANGTPITFTSNLLADIRTLRKAGAIRFIFFWFVCFNIVVDQFELDFWVGVCPSANPHQMLLDNDV
jgi:hypothetical protein